MFCRSLFLLFLLAIVLSFNLQIMITSLLSLNSAYIRRGWRSLEVEQHLKKKLHLDNLKIRKTNNFIYEELLSIIFGKEVCSFRIMRTLCISFFVQTNWPGTCEWEFLCPN
jgi:ABC-type dipeptide/oligopeptide/nickel transport system permease component